MRTRWSVLRATDGAGAPFVTTDDPFHRPVPQHAAHHYAFHDGVTHVQRLGANPITVPDHGNQVSFQPTQIGIRIEEILGHPISFLWPEASS
jgi:hypothetical protein